MLLDEPLVVRQHLGPSQCPDQATDAHGLSNHCLDQAAYANALSNQCPDQATYAHGLGALPLSPRQTINGLVWGEHASCRSRALALALALLLAPPPPPFPFLPASLSFLPPSLRPSVPPSLRPSSSLLLHIPGMSSPPTPPPRSTGKEAGRPRRKHGENALEVHERV